MCVCCSTCIRCMQYSLVGYNQLFTHKQINFLGSADWRTKVSSKNQKAFYNKDNKTYDILIKYEALKHKQGKKA